MNTAETRPQGISWHLRQTLSLAWPAILGQLGNILVGMADTAMIGQLSPAHQAAAALANSLFFLILVIGIGVMVAITPLVSQEQGREDEAESARYLYQGLWLALILGLVSTGITAGMYFLIDHLQQPPAVAAMAKSYLLILSLTCVPVLGFMAIKHFVEGYERTIPGMVVMYAIVLLNVCFNYVLIYGKFGLPRMELDGAGWATLLARICGFFILGGWVLFSKRFRPIVLGASRAFYGRIIRRIWQVGFPSGMQYFFEVGAFTGAVILAGHIGEIEQAAHQVAIQLAAFTYMIYVGLSTAAAIRVGHYVGARDAGGVRQAAQAVLLAGLIFIVLSVLAFVLLRHELPRLFTAHEGEIGIAASLLLIAAFFQVADGLQCITVGALRGLTDVRVPTVFIMIAYWVLGLPLAWVFMRFAGLGVEGLWYGLSLGLGFSALFLMLRLRWLVRGPLPEPPADGHISAGH